LPESRHARGTADGCPRPRMRKAALSVRRWQGGVGRNVAPYPATPWRARGNTRRAGAPRNPGPARRPQTARRCPSASGRDARAAWPAWPTPAGP
jgi:hypothetical protein